MGLFVIIRSWDLIFTYVINGIGEISLQLYLAIAQFITFIPLALGFIWFGLGVVGIVLSLIICYLPRAALLPVQMSKLLTTQDFE